VRERQHETGCSHDPIPFRLSLSRAGTETGLLIRDSYAERTIKSANLSEYLYQFRLHWSELLNLAKIARLAAKEGFEHWLN